MSNENVMKHLDYVQATINRLAQNSFTYKGWCITIVAAIYAFNSELLSGRSLLVGILPVLAFWGLDAYYLRQERLFRKLYDDMRLKADTNYSMDTSPYSSSVQTWLQTCTASSVACLYLPLLFSLIVVEIIRAYYA